MNTAVISHDRLLTFVGMLVRYGAVKITITDNPEVNCWTVEWENGK
jgi:hypothetical protein